MVVVLIFVVEVSTLYYHGLKSKGAYLFFKGADFPAADFYEVLPRLDNLCLFCGPHFPASSAPFEEQTTWLLIILDVFGKKPSVFAPRNW